MGSRAYGAGWLSLLSSGGWKDLDPDVARDRLQAILVLWESGQLLADPSEPGRDGVPLGFRILHDALASDGISGMRTRNLVFRFAEFLKSRDVSLDFLSGPAPRGGWGAVFEISRFLEVGCSGRLASDWLVGFVDPVLAELDRIFPGRSWCQVLDYDPAARMVFQFGAPRSGREGSLFGKAPDRRVGPLFERFSELGLLSGARVDHLENCFNPVLARAFVDLGVDLGSVFRDGRTLFDVWHTTDTMAALLSGRDASKALSRAWLMDLSRHGVSDVKPELKSSGISLQDVLGVPAYGVLDPRGFPDFAAPSLPLQEPTARDLTVAEEISVRAMSRLVDLYPVPPPHLRQRIEGNLKLVRGIVPKLPEGRAARLRARLDLTSGLFENVSTGSGPRALREMVQDGHLRSALNVLFEDLRSGLYSRPVPLLQMVQFLLLAECHASLGKDPVNPQRIPDELREGFVDLCRFMGEYASTLPDLPLRQDLVPAGMDQEDVRLASKLSVMFCHVPDLCDPMSNVFNWNAFVGDGQCPSPTSPEPVLRALVSECDQAGRSTLLGWFAASLFPKFGVFERGWSGHQRFEEQVGPAGGFLCGHKAPFDATRRWSLAESGIRQCLDRGVVPFPEWIGSSFKVMDPACVGDVMCLFKPPGSAVSMSPSAVSRERHKLLSMMSSAFRSIQPAAVAVGINQVKDPIPGDPHSSSALQGGPVHSRLSSR